MPLDRILEAQTKSEKAGENPGKSFSQNYQCANVICEWPLRVYVD